MTWTQYLQFALALGFVLALIGGLALLAQRFGLGHAPRRGAQRRLAVAEVMALDAKHKLVLVRRDKVEHLIVLGPGAPAVVETGLPAPTPFAAALAEAGR
ncbi:MAG: flagellar biosynthetic protein FliO [Rhodospirillales bacterium]|jgi:flagellar protein FliO/FliZ|nr:flagellar biosynthetic protein FliO [Rhodospirillales bacterium]